MTLYEIDNRLLALVDPETGEIADYEAFVALDMERTTKLENMACWVKDLKASAVAIATEIKTLTDRKRSLENKAVRLADYLGQALCGEKLTTPKCAVSWRKSKAVEVDDPAHVVAALEKAGRDDCLRYAMPTVNKTAVKALLEAGEEVEGCHLVERQNIQIK